MSKGKIVAAVVAVVVVGAVAAAVVANSTKSTQVDTAKVTRETLSITVLGSGKVVADKRYDVFPPTAGTLKSVEVTSGQRVKAGQVLAVMDTDPIKAQVAQAEAAYDAAVAQLASIKKQTPQSGDRAAAQAAVDAAKTAYDLAEARYKAAKSGSSVPTTEITTAQAAVTAAQAAYDAAVAAYTGFYTSVYLPAAQPRSAALETALKALASARDQAASALASAKQRLATLTAASGAANLVSAKLARDQALAAYLGAVAQQSALKGTSAIKSAIASAEAAISAAADARALARKTLDRATLTAPADGVVLFNSASSLVQGLGGAAGSSASTGDIAVGSAVSPASAPFSVVPFGTLGFNAQVDEADVPRVRTGMPASVSLDALPDKPFKSKVDRIGKESVLTATGGTAFPVYFRFEPGSEPALLGMNGSAEIEVDSIRDAVTVPVEALLEEGNVNYVFTVSGGRAHKVKIDVGRYTDTRAQILSGVSAGDEVIVSEISSLTDGARVRTR